MGAALLCTETWPEPPTIPDVDGAALESIRRDLRQLLDGARRARPGEGTPEETATLAQVSRLGSATWRVLGPSFVLAMRTSVSEALNDLVRREVLAADPERKLALRHVEQAVHRYGVVVEASAAPLADLPAAAIAALLEDLAHEVSAASAPVRSDDKLVLRFQLDVLVALDVLDASLDELTYWAFRAVTNARRVEAMPAAVVAAALRGELARVRTRRAWVGWDAAERAKELAPWPAASR
ncbi:MAG: hypothetical protein IT373_32805 [Polyangiaceae bacterium]|nr:hypothetical protein [Polyangiaceae bacterium]